MRNFLIAIARCGLLLAALYGSNVWASVCRVTTAGLPANDGSTWSVPMNLQTALGTSACTEIWVAAGIYLPTTPGGSTNASFVIAPGVAVYGGFAGGETQRAQRNWSLNVTTLSGDIGTPGTATETKTIVKMNGAVGNTITESTVLDGFTIADAYQGGSGGGLYCNGAGAGNECSPTLANLIFNNNYAVYGGAITNDAHGGGVSSPHLTNVAFTGNLAIDGGGAIYNYCTGGTSSPVLIGVTFSGNTVDGDPGGAMYDEFGGNSSPTLTNVTFSGNGGLHSGPPFFGGGAFNGGAISHRSTGTLSLNNVTFSANGSSSGPEGAIYLWTATSALVMSNVIMWGDLAGPEIDNAGGAPVTITSSVIQGGCPSGATCLGVITTDPMLGPLQDNGGPMQTMLLMSGSSAIDTGYNPTCAATDQRGVPRPQGANCDVGAVELVYLRIFADNFDGRPTP